MKKSAWPAWFPYPRAWLRTVALILWLGIVLRISWFWIAGLGIVSQDPEQPERLLVLLGLGLLLPFVLLAYTHYILFGKPPKRWPRWLPQPSSMWEGFYALFVSILATLAGVAVIMPFHDFSNNFSSQSEYVSYYQDPEVHRGGACFGLVVFVSGLYLYQVEHLVRRRLFPKSKAAPETAASKKRSDRP